MIEDEDGEGGVGLWQSRDMHERGQKKRKRNRQRVSWDNLYTAASSQGESKGMTL